MKRALTCLLALMVLLALAPAAHADIIWEPENSFYQRHAKECSYENRFYYANGSDGFVTAWNAPNGNSVEDQYENGEKLLIQFIYKDWGCIVRWDGKKEISGWIPLADLVLTYDYIVFQEEYADRITDYNGEFADYDGDDAVVNFFEYPGAESVKTHFNMSDDIRANLTGSTEGWSYIHSIFVDENGLTWGFVGYMYGRLNGWFCLDDPDGETFPVRQVGTETLIPARTPVMPVKGAIGAALPWVLVAAVVAVTGGLLLRMRKKARE